MWIWWTACALHVDTADLVQSPLPPPAPAAWVWTPEGGTLLEEADSLILWVGPAGDPEFAGQLKRVAAELAYVARPATDEDLRSSWPVAFLEERAADRLKRELRVDARSTGHPALVRLAVELLANGEGSSEAVTVFGAGWVEATL
jgi:hypothetical protein